jgi:hypothetical protein
MKTRIIIILALITLNFNLLSASNNSPKRVDGPSKSEMITLVTILAPVTPAEATFEDATEMNPVAPFLSSLAPVTPVDASFEEELPSGEETQPTFSAPVNQKGEAIDKGKTMHSEFPLPCDAKYGCGL